MHEVVCQMLMVLYMVYMYIKIILQPLIHLINNYTKITKWLKIEFQLSRNKKYTQICFHVLFKASINTYAATALLPLLVSCPS